MMITTTRMPLSLLLALGSMALGEQVCEFEVIMISNATTNNCFGGWALQQATALALPFLQSWKARVYPDLIEPSDECIGVKTLTNEEYNALDSDAKKVYRLSMRDLGWNTAYDLNFPYCKEKGYRTGFQTNYYDKLDPEDMLSDFVPIGAPSDKPPQEPGPKPVLVTTANYTKWYVAGYAKGWYRACYEGYREGLQDGKAAGTAALQSTTPLNVAFASASQQKDYNCTRVNDRNLRGAETSKDQDNRKLYGGAGYTCARWCYSNPNKYNYCMVMGVCSPVAVNRRDLESESGLTSSSSDGDEDETASAWESRFVETLFPMQGRSAGIDFKSRLGAQVGWTFCRWQDVTVELWERCPV